MLMQVGVMISLHANIRGGLDERPERLQAGHICCIVRCASSACRIADD
jgi:hypothetical protein